jgi:formate hydrogenlyase subunit 6/NADH:ubiquinone oxidoreductase subunit I
VGILDIVAHNMLRAARTRRPTDEVGRPSDLRGSIQHDAEKCVGCKTCEYVCATGGIKVAGVENEEAEWQYSAEQCAFCGRCVEFCPTQAVSLDQKPAAVSTDLAESKVAHRVPRQACARCGQPITQVPQPAFERLYGKPLPDNVMELRRYCAKCRGRIYSEWIKEAVTGPHHD